MVAAMTTRRQMPQCRPGRAVTFEATPCIVRGVYVEWVKSGRRGGKFKWIVLIDGAGACKRDNKDYTGAPYPVPIAIFNRLPDADTTTTNGKGKKRARDEGGSSTGGPFSDLLESDEDDEEEEEEEHDSDATAPYMGGSDDETNHLVKD